jgi:hypothetical protein
MLNLKNVSTTTHTIPFLRLIPAYIKGFSPQNVNYHHCQYKILVINFRVEIRIMQYF